MQVKTKKKEIEQANVMSSAWESDWFKKKSDHVGWVFLIVVEGWNAQVEIWFR